MSVSPHATGQLVLEVEGFVKVGEETARQLSALLGRTVEVGEEFEINELHRIQQGVSS